MVETNGFSARVGLSRIVNTACFAPRRAWRLTSRSTRAADRVDVDSKGSWPPPGYLCRSLTTVFLTVKESHADENSSRILIPPDRDAKSTRAGSINLENCALGGLPGLLLPCEWPLPTPREVVSRLATRVLRGLSAPSPYPIATQPPVVRAPAPTTSGTDASPVGPWHAPGRQQCNDG